MAKLTESHLRKIIKEELKKVLMLNEGFSTQISKSHLVGALEKAGMTNEVAKLKAFKGDPLILKSEDGAKFIVYAGRAADTSKGEFAGKVYPTDDYLQGVAIPVDVLKKGGVAIPGI